MQKQQQAAEAFIRRWSHIAPSRPTWRGVTMKSAFTAPQVKDLIAAASLKAVRHESRGDLAAVEQPRPIDPAVD
jgi:hypothetical protein